MRTSLLLVLLGSVCPFFSLADVPIFNATAHRRHLVTLIDTTETLCGKEYRFNSKVGEGAFGTVMKATHLGRKPPL